MTGDEGLQLLETVPNVNLISLFVTKHPEFLLDIIYVTQSDVVSAFVFFAARLSAIISIRNCCVFSQARILSCISWLRISNFSSTSFLNLSRVSSCNLQSVRACVFFSVAASSIQNFSASFRAWTLSSPL
ncbi:hypothetical protein DAI22_09g192766 [Oryza sativa Japonica Group]|nr:hypothetical protein DAI22_09g192766 [Oryza sativa Japonica Group]